MSISEESVQAYIDELDDLAKTVINRCEYFFVRIEAYKTIPRETHSPIWKWKTPEPEEKVIQRDVLEAYQEWYAGARELVAEYMQNELEKFEEHRDEFYDRITLSVPPSESSSMSTYSEAHDAFVTQRGVVNGIPRKIKAQKLKVKQQVSKSVAKDEIGRARQLFDEDLLRASGVLAGVALERHLLTKCQESERNVNFSLEDGIASLANTLYQADEIEKTTLSQLETLASIRNDCAHVNQTEPDQNKVRHLIEDTEDYIRGRGL